MTEERVPVQATREEAKHYILLTLDRFRVMTLHLAENKSRLPSALNGNEGGLDLLYELEARDFYSNLMFLYTSDIFEVLSSEGFRELLLKCKELSDRFCLKVRIPADIRMVGEDVIERFTSELTEESLGRLRENLGEVEQTRALLLAQAGDVDRGRADKSELETILSKRQEYEAAKKRHDEANHQIQLALPYCLDERACQPYYDIRRENKSIMDKIVREHPLVYHIKDRRDAKALRREINSTFDDIGAAISGIMNRIVEGKYPIWRFDALIEELLEKYTPEEAEQIKEHLARMKRSEDSKDLVLTIGSITLSVLTLLIPGGAVAGLLCARSGLQIAGVAVSVASAMNDLDDSLLYRQEVLAHTRVSPEIQELMEAENISLTDAQTQLLAALISSAFVGADFNDARKSLELIRKLDQLDDGVVTALKQSKRFGEKAFQNVDTTTLNHIGKVEKATKVFDNLNALDAGQIPHALNFFPNNLNTNVIWLGMDNVKANKVLTCGDLVCNKYNAIVENTDYTVNFSDKAKDLETKLNNLLHSSDKNLAFNSSEKIALLKETLPPAEKIKVLD